MYRYLRILMIVLFFSLILTGMSISQAYARTDKESAADGTLDAFLGEPQLQLNKIFDGERFPNVVVTTNGTVLATWGKQCFWVRRSENGGESFSEKIRVAKPGFQGGGLLVDQIRGDILAFVQDEHPPAPSYIYRSTDQGKSWEKEDLVIEKDINGNVPSMHMAEHGITLTFGGHKGRLLRAARVYGKEDKRYSTAIYSDDGGKNWYPSEPYPLKGTGEGAVCELSNGKIYYSSRKSWFNDVSEFRHQRAFGWSLDDGETWQNVEFDSELPDGPRYRGEERRGPNYNGHFGMMCGLVRIAVKHRDILIYSNADSHTHQRRRLTVWASFDGGKTWPVKNLVYEGPSAYSSLSAGRPGTPSEGWIYLQFEGGEEHKYEGGYFARFNLSWILQGERTGDGELPAWIRSDP